MMIFALILFTWLVCTTHASQTPPYNTSTQQEDTTATMPTNLYHQEAPGRERRPFGCWPSSLSALDATMAFNSFEEGPQVDPITDAVFWIESNEYGRNLLYQYDPKSDRVVPRTSEEFDVRSGLRNGHGSSFIVYNDTVIFSSATTGFLYAQVGAKGYLLPILEDPTKSYADGYYDAKAEEAGKSAGTAGLFETGTVPVKPENMFNMLFYVMEDKITETQSLIAYNLTSGEDVRLPVKDTFFASPVLSPDSVKLAWVQWQAPNMIWDDTRLVVASLEAGQNFKILKYIRHGSMMMLKWNQYNELLYVHDGSDWSNLYINNKRNFEINLTPFSANIGAGPSWKAVMAYDTSPKMGSYDSVVVVGKNLYTVNSLSKTATRVDMPYDSIYGPKYSNSDDKVYMLAGNATQRVTLIQLDLKTNETRVLLQKPSPLPPSDISQSQFIEFPTSDGEVAFGLFYRPKNSNYTSPEDSLPPLIVTVDEGPPRGAKTELDLEVQFFTSRGFAVFSVEHRGRGNHRRQFRKALYGKFGQMDVADVIAGTEYLLREEMIDPQRVGIRGKYLGGVTTLLTLASSDLFKAGTVYGSPSNTTELLKEASQFEGSYYQSLFVPISSKDNDSFSEPMSPIELSGNITAATLLFHGSEDHLVHPNHSVAMHEDLLNAGVEATLILKSGEGHVFTPRAKAECLEEELSFYRKVFEI